MGQLFRDRIWINRLAGRRHFSRQETLVRQIQWAIWPRSNLIPRFCQPGRTLRRHSCLPAVLRPTLCIRNKLRRCAFSSKSSSASAQSSKTTRSSSIQINSYWPVSRRRLIKSSTVHLPPDKTKMKLLMVSNWQTMALLSCSVDTQSDP